MKLDWKTVGISEPREKPRVWFTCHPRDFEEAFPLISQDIFRYSNCCIWYDTEPEAELGGEEREEFFASLDEMQLMVIAVTTRFIEEPSRARDVELPYAIAQHIPVLPILLEPGLARKFNQATNTSIQVVNRYSDDPTVIPYDEVLETYLKSVLIGDELAEQVRNAFDAYVFLSYRKKDREHAQRLMRLIHDNPQYRDFAIWYDEFLVPGENYTRAIQAALQKSTLFAMAVTKNLEDEGNYVMRKEYPEAHERAKKEKSFQIVSVELYKEGTKPEDRIDLENLKKHEEFPVKQIEKLQDEHRRPEVNQAFLDALARVSKKTNDGSARHRFFVGLAYLCGIDVEKNPKRAVMLIDSAANDPRDPCFEATEKLTDMYLNGDSVERNVDKAIEYQKQLCRQYRAEYEKHDSPDEHRGFGTKYFRALLRLSDILRDNGQRREAIAYAEEAMTVAESLTDEVGKREVARDTAVICTRLGRLCQERGEERKAEQYYGKAARIYETLAREIGTTRARRDLSIVKERLGDLARYQEQYATALQYYREACELRETLTQGSNSNRARRDYSAILTKLGNVLKNMGNDISQVKDYYRRAYEMDRLLAEEEKTVQARDDLGVSLVKLGDIGKAEKQYDEAEKYYREARQIFQELAEKRDTVSILRHCAGSCEKLASVLKRGSKPEDAVPLYEESVALREKIREKAPSPLCDHELAVGVYNYGMFREDAALLRRAADLWKQLSETNPKYEKYRARAEKLLARL